MNDSAIKPKNRNRKFYLGFAVVAVLIVVLVVGFFAFQNLGFRDTLLYNNAITVQAVTDKSAYSQGENVTILAYLTNGKNEAIPYPSSVGYSVKGSNGTDIFGMGLEISWAPPVPTVAPHSKALFSGVSDRNVSFIWNQEDINRSLVKSGNYTITVRLGQDTSECEIVIAD